jgi:predicted Zn-dependent protease
MCKRIKFLCCVISAGFLLNCSGSLTPPELFAQGEKLLKENKRKEAFKYFKKAADNSPDSGRYFWATATVAPEQNTAFIYAKAAWEKGLKSKTVLMTLLKLSFNPDKSKKLEYALSLYKELPDRSRDLEFKGDLYFQFAEFDSAIGIWKKLASTSPSADLYEKIATALVNKGESERAMTLLQDCRSKSLLNATGYIQLATLLALQYKYKEVDELFAEIQKTNDYTRPVILEHASFLLAQERYEDALSLINQIKQDSSTDMSVVNHRARIIKGFIYLSQGSAEKLDALISSLPSQNAAIEKEKEFYEALKLVMNHDSSAFIKLNNIRKELPSNPIVNLCCAREIARLGNFPKAIELYTLLPGAYLSSPRITIEYAMALAKTGKDDDALRRVSFMHENGAFTKQSLELFRDLTFKKKLFDKSNGAQQLLEKNFGNDISVKYDGILLAMKNGKIDSAYTLASRLAIQYPKESQFEITRLSILYLKKEYKKLIQAIPSSTAPVYKKKHFEAQAWGKLGDIPKAISAYEEAIKDKSVPQMLFELANLYSTNNNNSEASQLYKTLVEIPTEQLKLDSITNAILYNNYAWSLVESNSPNQETAIVMVKKAYAINADDPNIIDTYASILIKVKQFKECEKLLTSSKLTDTQSRLLYQLATVYEQFKETNKAVRYYQDAMKAMDSPNQLPFISSKEEIKKHIEVLINGK